MEIKIAQFVDNYDNANSDASDVDIDDVNQNVGNVDDDESTAWENFCAVTDAWARHAQGLNGFGSI